MAKRAATDAKDESSSEPKEVKRCGVVMPISAIDDCSERHWKDVRSILFDAITLEGFEPKLVSDADDVGVIHKRIVQNLYDNPIVVCDVSHRNPNVMFELGMRLAFDKPVVVVMDDRTKMPFDTGTIEYVQYPRDLRYYTIIQFSQRLRSKLSATYETAKKNDGYFQFLQQFGEFKLPKIEKNEVSTIQEYLEVGFADLRSDLFRLTKANVESRRQDSIGAYRYLSRETESGEFSSYIEDSELNDIVIKAVGDAAASLLQEGKLIASDNRDSIITRTFVRLPASFSLRDDVRSKVEGYIDVLLRKH